MSTRPPLHGIKVVEFGGLAPGPFAGLVLADWGADVIRIDRPISHPNDKVTEDVLARHKRSIAVDTKIPSGRAVVKRLVERADVLIDPFRPGVLERLGLGPEVFLGEKGTNKKLIYARLIGFPRTGQYSNLAGHDLNYLALSGVLSLLPGSPSRPTFPLNILADFAGGGLMCALGIMIALFERSNNGGLGQVVDNDMVSGTRYLSTFPLLGSFAHSLIPSPLFADRDATTSTRMQNTLDDGAPFYAVYTCADGKWMSVACIEPKFYKIFLEKFLDALPSEFVQQKGWCPKVEEQFVRTKWPAMKQFFEEGFKSFDRHYWAEVFNVLSPREAYLLASTDAAPKAHPNLSRTTPVPLSTNSSHTYLLRPGEHTDEILEEIGIGKEEKKNLAKDGALGIVQLGTKL
ncbi:unnamed protein product [Somion occarium]|uniref:Alpha-methylacyl-CoA racemase n=1 Tax=Somion occarium TaxID=3059160 RepID=A0ABP1CSY2_9APHY